MQVAPYGSSILKSSNHCRTQPPVSRQKQEQRPVELEDQFNSRHILHVVALGCRQCRCPRGGTSRRVQARGCARGHMIDVCDMSDKLLRKARRHGRIAAPPGRRASRQAPSPSSCVRRLSGLDGVCGAPRPDRAHLRASTRPAGAASATRTPCTGAAAT